ncbi:DUF3883 domain-containing protein [Mesorhizobium sp. BR1-1-3]|uniref:DUF3883 domain-containing protein n=1 Tax=Mesorhizobium sp. BR1-1-3 TaxID=2876651 RepID=UPI001CD05494|nr:DUF3883 domain-containing protein [Mesorhizobium sp. BR1-1-3]MBZ9892300.1 DUF3883 domain-containing protein [Mesorhizobium sp. BR1-1-3]
MAKLGAAVPPMIFFNVGWMKRYSGMADDDLTLGRHAYLRDHSHGHESFNFLPSRGKVYGYQPKGTRLSIKKLGAAPKATSISNVLVVWLATHPTSKQVLVVGWYRDATVFRERVPRVPRGVDFEITYSAVADASKAVLLPEIARTFRAPTHHDMKGGLGQSPVWYGATDAFRKRVWSHVQSVDKNRSKKPTKSKARSPRNFDPELRRKIEKAAVDHATAFFESDDGGRYDVISVEPYGRGWDLEATRGNETLLIEVKGLGRDGDICELTPNEYSKARDAKHRQEYVIYIVNECLSDRPMASIFRYTSKAFWETEDGRRLSVTPLEGARLKVIERVGAD